VFESEPPLEVADEMGNILIIYRPDFRIEGKLCLEIKALSHLLTNHEIAQVIDYFAADVAETCAAALLINFGLPRLNYKRVFPPKKIREHRQVKKWGKTSASTNKNE
jgi:GxxExxY protein